MGRRGPSDRAQKPWLTQQAPAEPIVRPRLRLVLRSESIFDETTRQADLARRSVQGGVVTLTGQGARFALQLVGTVVLARLLTPSEFGLVAMVSVIIAFGQVLREAGLPTATVQQQGLTADQVSVLFWANVATSVGLGAVLALGAPLVSAFYGRSELTAVTVALAVSFALGGLANQHGALLQRQMYFTSLAVVQIASQAAYLAVAVAMALAGYGYWSLVGGNIAQSLTLVLGTLLLCRWRPGRPRRGAGSGSMLRFGGNVLGFDLVNYFSRNMDNILIGRYLGAAPLGLYARAYNLFMLPITQIRTPVTQVAMPALSALRPEPERYRRYYRHTLTVLALLTVPLTLWCLWEAAFIIEVALGPQWTDAVPVFRILAVSALVQPVASTRGLVLLSLGLSQRYFRWGLANAILNVAAFVAGLPFGIEGVAAAYAVANYAIVAPSLYYCLRGTPVRQGDFWRAMVGPLAVGALASLVFAPLVGVGPGRVALHGSASVAFMVLYFGGVWAVPALRGGLKTMWAAFRSPAAEVG